MLPALFRGPCSGGWVICPHGSGVYFLLAMCLFPEVRHRLVRDRPTVGLSRMPVACPTAKALRHLRRRRGSAPVRVLFEVLAGPPARPGMPGCGSARAGRCLTRRPD
ncbi:transposase domain-containing protein [Streptomyces sp. NPDC087263]|uniref:transposase domain-containing protein n=1 Tax=Streptomyces sp. NPDC087263 TaxID=3365773 RepID=UPI003830D155